MQIDSIIVSSEHIMDTLNDCKYAYIIHIITKKGNTAEKLRVNLKIYICFILLILPNWTTDLV